MFLEGPSPLTPEDFHEEFASVKEDLDGKRCFISPIQEWTDKACEKNACS